LSTAEVSSGHKAQHSAQKEVADAQSTVQELIVQEVEFSIENELRDVPQSTRPAQELEDSTQVELQDALENITQEIEPFAQPRSQGAHQSSIEEFSGETPQSPRPRELQAAPQSTLEESPTREIPSTTQDQPQNTLRTPSQLCGRQPSQVASEEQTTILDSSVRSRFRRKSDSHSLRNLLQTTWQRD
jgi:hypothetical protein